MKIKFKLLLGLIFFSKLVFSAPWVEPTDVHLRSDIQLLATKGIIKAPVNTFPLMWINIISDIKNTKMENYPVYIQQAIARVNLAFNRETAKQTSILSFSGATNPAQFRSYGTPYREEIEVNASHEFLTKNLAGKISVTVVNDPDDDEELRLDGSYFSFIWKNWVFSAGQTEKWWGPGWDTALTRSTNARPMPALTLARANSDPFETPWLSWIGEWTFSTSVNLMDDEDFRTIEDTLLWDLRATIRPVDQLELGVSRSIQMCGDDRSCSLSTIWDAFKGDDNGGVNVERKNEPGNQIASGFVRWSDSIFDIPYSFYYEDMGEDGQDDRLFPPWQARSHLYGADVVFNFKNRDIRVFTEFVDTFDACSGKECTYNHHIYKAGYRYYGRTLGASYDNGAEVLTLGLIGFERKNQHQWKANFKYGSLNQDYKKYASSKNSITDVDTDLMQINASYIFPYKKARIEIGSSYTNLDYKNDKSDDKDFDVWANIKFKF